MTTDQRSTSPALRAGGRGALVVPALVAAVAAAVTTWVGLVDPHVAGHYPTCPFLAVTGLYCPGCGSLRAMHDLAHGDLGGALSRNPLAVVFVLGLAVGWALWARRLWRGQPRTRVAPAGLLYGLLGLVVAFWVLRNVPGWTWLSPA